MPETIAPAPNTDARIPILDVPAAPLRNKCPYLAGRPPHGTYHLRPSGGNVCFARPDAAEKYGPVSKETQDSRCFCAAAVYERCPDYERARAGEIPVPTFEPPALRADADGVIPGVQRKKVKRRHRWHSRSRQWWHQNLKLVLTVAYWVLIGAASCWVVWRSL